MKLTLLFSGPLEIRLTVKNICHEYHCIVMMLTRRIFTPSDAFLPDASQSVIKSVIKLCYACLTHLGTMGNLALAFSPE
jgi:hypothetical protein